MKKVAELPASYPIKQGNGYGFRLNKGLVDCKVVDPSKRYVLLVYEEQDAEVKKSSSNGRHGFMPRFRVALGA